MRVMQAHPRPSVAYRVAEVVVFVGCLAVLVYAFFFRGVA